MIALNHKGNSHASIKSAKQVQDTHPANVFSLLINQYWNAHSWANHSETALSKKEKGTQHLET